MRGRSDEDDEDDEEETDEERPLSCSCTTNLWSFQLAAVSQNGLNQSNN